MQTAKKQIADYKLAKGKTGGGPPPKPLPDLIQRIWDFIPNQFERIPNTFDDDESINEENNKVTSATPTTVTSYLPHTTPTTASRIIPTSPTIPLDAHPGGDTVVMTSSPKKRKSINYTFYLFKINSILPFLFVGKIASQPASSNDDILALKKRLMLQEHECRLKILNEEHAFKMEAMKLEMRASLAKERYYSQLALPPPTPPSSQIQYAEFQNVNYC